jgi:hypothetical protein
MVYKEEKRYNFFNNIIAGNIPSLEKGRDIQVWEAFRNQTGRIRKETSQDIF